MWGLTGCCEPQDGFYAHRVQATGSLVADRGANACYPSPHPLGLRVEGANGPTNVRSAPFLY
jgi:hypothetical protein